MKVLRHLTLGEMRNMRKLEADSGDELAISLACGVPLLEAQEFFRNGRAGDVMRCLQEIMEISGLTEGAQFPDSAADDVELAREDVDGGRVRVLPGGAVGEDGAGD